MASALEAEGWRVLDRNWHARGGELDLVVGRDGAVRFVEVRARQSGDESALESITPAKQRRLVRAAESWLLAHGGEHPSEEPHEVAFLVAEVCLHPDGWTVELLDDAFDG